MEAALAGGPGSDRVVTSRHTWRGSKAAGKLESWSQSPGERVANAGLRAHTAT